MISYSIFSFLGFLSLKFISTKADYTQPTYQIESNMQIPEETGEKEKILMASMTLIFWNE